MLVVHCQLNTPNTDPDNKAFDQATPARWCSARQQQQEPDKSLIKA
jgi:hypothetical protein